MVDTVEMNRFDDIPSKQQSGVKNSSFESDTKDSSEHSVLTLRCSNKMDFTTNSVTIVEEHNEDDHPGTKSLSRRRLVGTMKTALSLSAKKLRRKDKESRIDEMVELDENRNHNDTREGVHLHIQSSDFSLSLEDFMLDPNQEQVSKPTNKDARSVKQTPSKRDKIKNLFKSRKDKSKIDMDIGIKLALPDKIDVMRGLEAPSNCTSSTQSESDEKNGIDIFSSSQKKLMILPDKSTNVLTRSLTSMSPFKKVPKSNRAASDSILTSKRSSSHLNEIVLRSSELEPSFHQTTIPTATEVLIHARVCALMEGYDQLLEARAKAGKCWFSFGDLVGVNRLDLKNMYLNAIRQNPEVPMYIGQDTYQPPPLPQGAVNFQSRNDFGNPFEASKTCEFGSHTSVANSSQSTTPRSHHQKKVQSKSNTTQPHPSIIKSLLECADDIVVENYFNETIGEDSELLETSSSSVQATILSSQRQREFIVCFRGSMQQHTKPIQSKSTQTVDKNGGK